MYPSLMPHQGILPRLFSSLSLQLQDNKVAEENVFKRTPCRSMGRNAFSGCFDLRLSRLRRDSRAAQHDKFETFF